MTWKTLTALLVHELRALRRMQVVSFGFAREPATEPGLLRAEELQCAERIDQIARDFARTHRWPALDEKERFFLRERLRFAYEYACIAEITVRRPLSLATRPNVVNEQRRLLEWLLIDVWRNTGVVNWLEPLFLIKHTNSPIAEIELKIAE